MKAVLPELRGLNEHIAMYAVVGMCVSEAAEIEWHLFECYFLASGLELEDAIREFHRHVQFEHKRRLTDRALQQFLDGADLEQWKRVAKQVEDVCGPKGARNLVSHNPVRASIYASMVAEKVVPDSITASPEIAQNAHLVRANKRADRRENLASLSNHVRELRAALTSLKSFWDDLADMCSKYD